MLGWCCNPEKSQTDASKWLFDDSKISGFSSLAMTWQMATYWKKRKKNRVHKWMGMGSLLESKSSQLPQISSNLIHPFPFPCFPHGLTTCHYLKRGWHGKILIDKGTSLFVDKMENHIPRGKKDTWLAKAPHFQFNTIEQEQKLGHLLLNEEARGFTSSPVIGLILQLTPVYLDNYEHSNHIQPRRNHEQSQVRGSNHKRNHAMFFCTKFINLTEIGNATDILLIFVGGGSSHRTKASKARGKQNRMAKSYNIISFSGGKYISCEYY